MVVRRVAGAFAVIMVLSWLAIVGGLRALPYVRALPRPDWLPIRKPREYWLNLCRRAVTEANLDYTRTLPEGKWLRYRSTGLQGDFDDVHDGALYTEVYEERFEPPKPGAQVIELDGRRFFVPENITYTSALAATETLPHRREVVVVFRDGRFRPLEWHMTREAGRDIPVGEQVKHYVKGAQ